MLPGYQVRGKDLLHALDDGKLISVVKFMLLSRSLCAHPSLNFLFVCVDVNSGPIWFYRRGEPYFEFTNFAEFPIVIDEVLYPTTEHYFQSQKLIGTPFFSHICQLPTARQAFEFPRQPHVSPWIRRDWQTVKDDVMFRALVAKFKQYRRLQYMLLSTGNRELVEHSPYDSYWGDGGDGKGLNRLGELLMKVRELLNFVKDCGESGILEDENHASPINHSQHSRQHVGADGDPISLANDNGHVPNNNGGCSSFPTQSPIKHSSPSLQADGCTAPSLPPPPQAGNNHLGLSHDCRDCS